jgi:hypothetical protein
MTIADTASSSYILVVNHARVSLSYKTRESICENNYKYSTLQAMTFFFSKFLI